MSPALPEQSLLRGWPPGAGASSGGNGSPGEAVVSQAGGRLERQDPIQGTTLGFRDAARRLFRNLLGQVVRTHAKLGQDLEPVGRDDLSEGVHACTAAVSVS